MPARLSGLAITEVVAGLVLAWSGYKNDSVAGTVRSVLKGQAPAAVPEAPPTIGTVQGSGATTSGTVIGPVSNAAVANAALSYTGHCYSWGGAPGRNGQGCWDCSSFVNYVLGVRLGLPIPGCAAGKYDGSVHGPTTLSYLAWSGATTVGHSASDAQAGDLVVWQTHMGVATGGGQYVSALNPSLGTQVSPITGNGEVLYVRRLR